MEPISIVDAAKAMNARIAGSVAGSSSSICTDTRDGAAGSLFFALHGENSDGHRYAASAAEQGAAAVVVDHELTDVAAPQLVVHDTLKALGDLARSYRNRFDIPVVGITGSVGKTSTKEMIACALGVKFKVLAGQKNFNNEIGVPKTLFGLGPEHHAAVIEMAMRGAGQIAWLADVARPRIGVITNIGLSHIELLGSRENIAAAKAELLDAVPPDGLAILNADDEYCDFLRSKCHCPVVTFGVQNDAGFRAADARFTDSSSTFRVNGIEFRINATGVHHVINACAACAAASHLGIALHDVAAQLETFQAPAMRMESTTRTDGTTILNDTYNAAPDSMRAALETLRLLAGGRRRAVAVLGDMRELGEYSRDAHRYVGETAGDAGIDLLVTVGEAAAGIADAAYERLGPAKIERYADTLTAADQIPSLIRPGDLVLVKGSRAMEMEKIVQALTR